MNRMKTWTRDHFFFSPWALSGFFGDDPKFFSGDPAFFGRDSAIFGGSPPTWAISPPPSPVSTKVAYGSTKEDSPLCDVLGFENTMMKLLRHVSFVDCPGVLRVNQLIEFSPGIVMKDESGNIKCTPIYSRIVSLYAEQNELQFAVPGGLIGVGTTMDPTLTRADRLVGQVLGEVNSLPDVFVHIAFAQLTVGHNLQSTCYWLIGDACLLKIGAEFKLGIEHWKLERKLCDELTKNKDVDVISIPTDSTRRKGGRRGRKL